MNSAVDSCRVYIVYRHELFAQGLRSVLSRESAVQIVGMENHVARAVQAVQALHPDVLLIEEAAGCEITWPFLEAAVDSRIVTFSLHHVYATVYDHHRMAATEPAELVKAILERTSPWDESPDAHSNPQGGLASTADRLTPGSGNHSEEIDRGPPPDPFNPDFVSTKNRRSALDTNLVQPQRRSP